MFYVRPPQYIPVRGNETTIPSGSCFFYRPHHVLLSQGLFRGRTDIKHFRSHYHGNIYGYPHGTQVSSSAIWNYQFDLQRYCIHSAVWHICTINHPHLWRACSITYKSSTINYQKISFSISSLGLPKWDTLFPQENNFCKDINYSLMKKNMICYKMARASDTLVPQLSMNIAYVRKRASLYLFPPFNN